MASRTASTFLYRATVPLWANSQRPCWNGCVFSVATGPIEASRTWASTTSERAAAAAWTKVSSECAGRRPRRRTGAPCSYHPIPQP